MKHYFLGSNTPDGFVGYYNQVNKGGNRLFILKGGSGVGKHTFMKKTAGYFEDKGYNVEYCHCSNDVNSLDGIVIPALAVAMIDGTAPHMVDPVLPAAFDEIIDLGKYIDVKEAAQHKDEINTLISKKKSLYSRAYSYLKAAKIIHDDTDALIKGCIEQEKYNHILMSLPKSLVYAKENQSGTVKHIFASAYTSSGYVDYIGTLVKDVRTVALKGYYCLNRDIMQAIYEYARLKNMNMTVCHSITDPQKIDHLLLEDVNIISLDEHNKLCDTDEIINLKDVVNKDKILDANEDITWNNNHFDEMIEKATDVMSRCGQYHSKLEAKYIPAMDFEGVNREQEIVVNKIKEYIL